MDRKLMKFISCCPKKNSLIETLAEEIPTVALRETKFESHDESNEHSVFGYFRPSS